MPRPPREKTDETRLALDYINYLSGAYVLAKDAAAQGDPEIINVTIGFIFDALDWLRRQNITRLEGLVLAGFSDHISAKSVSELENIIEAEFYPELEETSEERCANIRGQA